ncbi:MAG: hypothetical protein K9J37_09545 [Saprospiraceae bacterium]|nr:hypothetical protein [Saprospiraceae bacterium]MCF8250147.1 hypothetical protein [Saprospiraceae bacterium]MCF8311201.1 hypothetical protein [Saprospiraceae bacterium]
MFGCVGLAAIEGGAGSMGWLNQCNASAVLLAVHFFVVNKKMPLRRKSQGHFEKHQIYFLPENNVKPCQNPHHNQRGADSPLG